MPSIKYLARVIRGMRFDKLNSMLDVVKEKSVHSKLRTFCSMVWCGLRYGAGYYDYVMFGFYNMKGKERNTYLTRVRNKKVCELMNDYSFAEEFDDKLRFNKRFSKYLHRKTLNGETCSLEEFADFLEGQESIFAKPNHGSCGKGVTKLKVADFADSEAMLNHIRSNQLIILEHTLPQHESMAKLHPNSVNTLRIVTDLVGETVHIAYIMVKIGRGGHCCDNTGQGGMLCRVDTETGKIRSVATDDYFNIFEAHPDTGVIFQGYEIPMLAEAIALAKEAALEIPQMRHIGWDIAITPDGPAIIEGNEYPGTDLCQLAPHYPEKQGLWPYYKELLSL
ncbi:MAG: hypothetical protein IKM59_05700 [Oscillospiraceae bacterium]|nr:hypothetical protein [Oscillospiraceae bacterium]